MAESWALRPYDIVVHGSGSSRSPIDKRIVVFLAIAEFQILDLAGPYEVFEGANTAPRAQGRAGGYQLVVASSTPGRVATSGGLGLHADALPEPDRALDTLVIPGGNGPREVSADSTSAIWVRQVAPHCRRIATVCTGAFVAGRAGLLVGRTVATHRFRTQQLQAEFPDTVVDPDRLYLRDGELWSSGGVTAGVDLALALVEDDHDADWPSSSRVIWCCRGADRVGRASTPYRCGHRGEPPLRSCTRSS